VKIDDGGCIQDWQKAFRREKGRALYAPYRCSFPGRSCEPVLGFADLADSLLVLKACWPHEALAEFCEVDGFS
jgi:hypothetical protein